MLVISLFVLLAAVLLKVGPEGGVFFPFFPDTPVPKTCMSRDIFGVDCPGCGLTRSFIHFAHWDWRASWSTHHLGWLLFLTTVLQIPYRVQALLGKKGSVIPLPLAKAFGTVIIALLVLNWFWMMLLVSLTAGN